MATVTIEAIQVPFTPFLSYGIDKDGKLAFVYSHATQRGAEMKTSRIGNGNDKNWKPEELTSWGWIGIEEKHHTTGIKVYA